MTNLRISIKIGLLGVGLALVASACSLASEPTTTSTTEEQFHRVISVREARPGDELAVVARQCVSRPERQDELLPWLASKGINDTPQYSDYEFRLWMITWATQNPSLALEACANLSDGPTFSWSGTNVMTRALTQATRSVADNFVSPGVSPEVADLSEYGLDDTQIVWCRNQRNAVLTAADVLGIGPADSPELSTRLYVTTDIPGYPPLIDQSARSYLDENQEFELWWNRHFDWVARSCEAAFGAR